MLSAEIPPHPCHIFLSPDFFFQPRLRFHLGPRHRRSLSPSIPLTFLAPRPKQKTHSLSILLVGAEFRDKEKTLRLMASRSRGGSRKGVEKGSAGGLICTLQILTLSSTVLTLRGGGRSLNSKLRTLFAAAAQLQCRRRRLRGTTALEGEKAATAFSIHPPLTSGLGLFPPSAGITILLGKLALILFLRTLPRLFFSSFHSSSTRLHPRRNIICVRPSAPTLRLCRRRPPPVLSLPFRKTVPVERPSPPYATLRSSLCDKGRPRGFSRS